MSDYTIKNLMEIENSAAERGIDGLESRFGRPHMDSEHLGVTHFRYKPGFRAPYGHKHREQEEAYVVVRGGGRANLDGEIVDVRQWDVIRVRPQVARAFEAGPDGLELIAIGSDRPEGGDGELVQDFWTD